MANKKEKTFEENLAELETIVGELEEGDLPLEQSIQKYQDGIQRLKACHLILENAQKRVDLLTKDAKGLLATEPMETEDDSVE